MTLRLPDDVDAQVTERAKRENKTKAQIVEDAVRRDNDRAALTINDVMDDLFTRDAEILDRLA